MPATDISVKKKNIKNGLTTSLGVCETTLHQLTLKRKEGWQYILGSLVERACISRSHTSGH